MFILQTFGRQCRHTNTAEANLTHTADLLWVKQIPSAKEHRQCHRDGRSVRFSPLSLQMHTSCHHCLGGTWQARSQSGTQRFSGYEVLLSFPFLLCWSHTLWSNVITNVKKPFDLFIWHLNLLPGDQHLALYIFTTCQNYTELMT